MAHVLSTNGCINAGFMQNVEVEPETEFQTHVDMREAVDNLFEGETLFIRASKTTMPILGHLHDLNESNVILQGSDVDDVIIWQAPVINNFICTSGQDIVLTFMSSPDNMDGVLRVEKVQTVVDIVMDEWTSSTTKSTTTGVMTVSARAAQVQHCSEKIKNLSFESKGGVCV